MAFNQQSEYPRGTFYSALDAGATTIVAGTGADTASGGTTDATIKVSSIVIANNSGSPVLVTLTDFDASNTFGVFAIPARGSVEIKRGFESKAGLAFAIGAATTHVSVFYYKA